MAASISWRPFCFVNVVNEMVAHWVLPGGAYSARCQPVIAGSAFPAVAVSVCVIASRPRRRRGLRQRGRGQHDCLQRGAGLVDRLVVGIAPTIIGAGTEAVGTLGITTVADGIRLVDRSVYVLDDDMLLAWDVARCR